MYQPGKADNSAFGQLNRENVISLSPITPENLVSRGGSAVRSRVNLFVSCQSNHWTRLLSHGD